VVSGKSSIRRQRRILPRSAMWAAEAGYTTIALKVRLENPKGAYVPGMTAEVLISPQQLKGVREQVSKFQGFKEQRHIYG